MNHPRPAAVVKNTRERSQGATNNVQRPSNAKKLKRGDSMKSDDICANWRYSFGEKKLRLNAPYIAQKAANAAAEAATKAAAAVPKD